jgi:hypothetical protein
MTDTQRTYDEATDSDPGSVIERATERVLDLARTWLAWDGTPRLSEDGDRVYTPHKAMRRYADHLIDHLAEIECRLAGLAPLPDHWHGRTVTTHADFARFTETDLDEARSRLTRLAACYRARLAGVGDDVLDARPDPDTWPIRQVVQHVAGITYYARSMS